MEPLGSPVQEGDRKGTPMELGLAVVLGPEKGAVILSGWTGHAPGFVIPRLESVRAARTHLTCRRLISREILDQKKGQQKQKSGAEEEGKGCGRD